MSVFGSNTSGGLFRSTTGTGTSAGLGGFGASSSQPPGGGLFGTTSTSPLGTRTGTSAFGTGTQTGGLFGSSTTTTGSTGFGGSAIGTGGGLFPSSNAAGGFGTTSGAFGTQQQKPSGLGTGLGGSSWLSSDSNKTGTTGGLWGNQTSGFGTATTTQNQQIGTKHLRYSMGQYNESNKSPAVWVSVVSITFMKEISQKKSLDELRWEDYTGQSLSNTSQTQPTAGIGTGLFGSTLGTSGGQTGTGLGGGLFGTNNASTGTGTGTGGSLWGSSSTTNQGASLFGTKPTTSTLGSGGLFGSSTGTQGAFGTSTNQTGTFGAGTGGLFGSKPATSGFGTSTTTTGGGLFGTSAPQTQTSGLFGKPAAGGSPFGSTAGTTSAFGTTSTGLGGAKTGLGGTTGGGLFGTGTGSTGTSLWGAKPANSTTTGGGLFGTSSTQPQTTQTGGLFGTSGTGTGSLFGNSTTAGLGQKTGLFGSTTTGTGAFGTSTSGSLFGKPAGTGSLGTATSLFGKPATATTSSTGGTGGGLFGTAKPTTSLFGTSASSQTQPSTSLFGTASSTQPQQQGGLFSSQPAQSSFMFGQGQSALSSSSQGAPTQSQLTPLLSTTEAVRQSLPSSHQCSCVVIPGLLPPARSDPYGGVALWTGSSRTGRFAWKPPYYLPPVTGPVRLPRLLNTITSFTFADVATNARNLALPVTPRGTPSVLASSLGVSAARDPSAKAGAAAHAASRDAHAQKEDASEESAKSSRSVRLYLQRKTCGAHLFPSRDDLISSRRRYRPRHVDVLAKEEEGLVDEARGAFERIAKRTETRRTPRSEDGAAETTKGASQQEGLKTSEKAAEREAVDAAKTTAKRTTRRQKVVSSQLPPHMCPSGVPKDVGRTFSSERRKGRSRRQRGSTAVHSRRAWDDSASEDSDISRRRGRRHYRRHALRTDVSESEESSDLSSCSSSSHQSLCSVSSSSSSLSSDLPPTRTRRGRYSARRVAEKSMEDPRSSRGQARRDTLGQSDFSRSSSAGSDILGILSTGQKSRVRATEARARAEERERLLEEARALSVDIKRAKANLPLSEGRGALSARSAIRRGLVDFTLGAEASRNWDSGSPQNTFGRRTAVSGAGALTARGAALQTSSMESTWRRVEHRYRDTVARQSRRGAAAGGTATEGVARRTSSEFKPRIADPSYTTSPSLPVLRAMSDAALQAVKDFKICRYGHGGVIWPGKTDVRGVVVGETVQIEDRTIDVYPEEWLKENDFKCPSLGHGLNKRAIVTFNDVRPELYHFEDPEEFRTWLREQTEEMGGKFLSLEDNWDYSFEVPHFSRYDVRSRSRTGISPSMAKKGSRAFDAVAVDIPTPPVSLSSG